MALQAQSLALLMLLVLVLVPEPITIEGSSTPKEVHENSTNSTTSPSSSPVLMEKDDNQITACEPAQCGGGEVPPRFICCRNRCVDVSSDNNNCGLCDVTCPGIRQCCNRLCLNLYLNFFNCGRCGRRCPLGTICIFGSCILQRAQPIPLSPSIPSPTLPLSPPSGPSPMYPPFPPEAKSLKDQPDQYHHQPPEMD